MTSSNQSQILSKLLERNRDDKRTSKIMMIRSIQKCQGAEPCFATDKRHDCAEICEWRRDCRQLVAAWLRH